MAHRGLKGIGASPYNILYVCSHDSPELGFRSTRRLEVRILWQRLVSFTQSWVKSLLQYLGCYSIITSTWLNVCRFSILNTSHMNGEHGRGKAWQYVLPCQNNVLLFSQHKYAVRYSFTTYGCYNFESNFLIYIPISSYPISNPFPIFLVRGDSSFFLSL